MEESKSETVIELDYPAVRLGRNFAGRFFVPLGTDTNGMQVCP